MIVTDSSTVAAGFIFGSGSATPLTLKELFHDTPVYVFLLLGMSPGI